MKMVALNIATFGGVNTIELNEMDLVRLDIECLLQVGLNKNLQLTDT